MRRKAALIGHPVSHSLSPRIHDYWMKEYKINGAYEAIDAPPENLAETIERLRQDKNCVGFNVTIPHKINVMPFCDILDPLAESIGAVNTVIIGADGELAGTNTDAYGAIENLRAQQPDWDGNRTKALVIGAGGAARAILYGLVNAGCKDIILCNRTQDRADMLAKTPFTQGLVRTIPWMGLAGTIGGRTLVINTTSMGMKGQEPLVPDFSAAPDDMIIYDIVYAPLITPFLRAARGRGLKTVTGIGMLLHQARPAFQAWFGTLPDISPELERLVLS